jgi:ribonuclease HII
MPKKNKIRPDAGRLGAEIGVSRSGFELVIGIDEAGRGPLAGPVCAGAAAIVDLAAADGDFQFLLRRVDDSKRLTPALREEIYGVLTKHPALVWGFASATPTTIDKINILQASRLAMKRAVRDMLRRSGIVLAAERVFCFVDGNVPLDVVYPQKTVVGGDRQIFSISAASIIAKVGRDRLMRRMDKKFSGYGFGSHKGYGTQQHLRSLARLGPCAIHRKSFGPVANCVKKFSTG